jgi:hypothetical protein
MAAPAWTGLSLFPRTTLLAALHPAASLPLSPAAGLPGPAHPQPCAPQPASHAVHQRGHPHLSRRGWGSTVVGGGCAPCDATACWSRLGHAAPAIGLPQRGTSPQPAGPPRAAGSPGGGWAWCTQRRHQPSGRSLAAQPRSPSPRDPSPGTAVSASAIGSHQQPQQPLPPHQPPALQHRQPSAAPAAPAPTRTSLQPCSIGSAVTANQLQPLPPAWTPTLLDTYPHTHTHTHTNTFHPLRLVTPLCQAMPPSPRFEY